MSNIARGDIVHVVKVRPFGADALIPAKVLWVDEDRIAVEALPPHKLGPNGEDRLILEKRAEGRTWR